MNTSSEIYENVEDYIARYPASVQDILNRVRSLIKNAAPDAAESISYGMPAYKQNGKPLVYFAAFEKHIGFYATPHTHEGFAAELGEYKQGKGSVQFPLDRPIPYDLISRMTMYKVGMLTGDTTNK